MNREALELADYCDKLSAAVLEVKYSVNKQFLSQNIEEAAQTIRELVAENENPIKDHHIREINNELTKMLKDKFNIEAQCLRSLVWNCTNKALKQPEQEIEG